MRTYLNVGLIQSPGKDMSFEGCLDRLEHEVDLLMAGMNRPELVLGVEMGIGRYFRGSDPATPDSAHAKATTPDFVPPGMNSASPESNPAKKLKGDTIPGTVTARLSAIAAKHGIYFAPGSMLHRVDPKANPNEVTNEEPIYYNTAPIFGPDGELIDTYSKICPYKPMEDNITPGDRYVTFDIKEKDVRIGVMICHDWCFPEISRNLALMGADILFRPAVDPEGLYDVCKTIPQTRAFENQCYFISLNMSGEWLGCYAYGHSMVADPDGHLIYEAGENPTALTLTLDIDHVRDARRFGTCYTEQLIRQLPYFKPPMPFHGDLSKAPVYERLDPPDMTPEQRDEHVAGAGIQTIMAPRK